MSTEHLPRSTDKALISMSVPVSLGMLSTFLFQVIDTYFVGQLGSDALAALSFASTIYFLLVALFMGLAVGVSVLVGSAQGAKDGEKIYFFTALGLLLTALMTIAISLLIIALHESIFSLLGASDSLIPTIASYIKPLVAGLPLLTVSLMAGATLRATGNVSKPELIMAIAGIVNLVFDYLLIFGKLGLPELGIRGAAYATVLSWFMVIVGMLILLKRDRLLVRTKGFLHRLPEGISEIFHMSIPTMITQMAGPFTLIFLTALVATHSSDAVAAFGVASRIETLLMIGILGVSTILTPYISQNHGAREHSKIDQAVAFGGRASTYLGLIVFLLLLVFIRPIAGIFSSNPEVIAVTSNYFYWVAMSYIFYGFFVVTSSIFNGLQLPINSLRIVMVRALCFTIPMAFMGSFWGVTGIFAGISLSNVAAGVYAMREMRKQLKKVNSSIKELNVWHEYRQDFAKLIRRLGSNQE